jgi:opacity protein-like surface antigen
MANVYYDVATYGVLTPYVTVGAGHARNTLKKYRAVTAGVTGVGTAKSHTTNNFAWAVGAGAHASLGNGVFADVGYRFIDIGKVKSATVNFADGPDTPYHSKKVHAHEVIASIRYEF